MPSELSPADKVLLRSAAKEAVRIIKIRPADTDRDILGKLFTHFRQAIGTRTLSSYNPKRVKQILYSHAGSYEYVKELLVCAMEKLTRQDVKFSLKSSVLLAKSIASEAERINQKSSIVADAIDKIARRLEDGRQGR